MASLNLNHIYKVYPNGVKAVNDFCMDIEDKEFIVFVGPSGCGKSTTLRMIAGLEEITAGELKIGENVVNDMEPKDRDIAMVFQNYALYPHMSVYDNMAFALKLRKIPTPVLDKDGAPVLQIDNKKIREINKKLKNVEHALSGNSLDEEAKSELLAKKQTLKEELQYYTETPVPVYSLKHMPKEEIDRRVKEAANILGITEYLDRKPKAMSGGQKQRVALGRAIVREPKVFLLDEPLSNLDAKLRTAMRSEISKLHRKLQTTFIYVTHDQVEAMTMGTRIVVMKDGFVQQIDTPRNLYRFPGNKFVAGFIGTPQMNFFEGKLKLNSNNKVTVTFENTNVSVEAPLDYFIKVDKSYLNGETPVIIGLRAEHISADPDLYPFKAQCRVSHVEELGTDCQIFADFNLESEETISESATRVIAKAAAGTEYDGGEIITVSLDLSQIHLFDTQTEVSIAPVIPEKTVVPCKVQGGKLGFLGASIALPKAIVAEDGEYDLSVPTRAISLGGKIQTVYDTEELVNGQRLLHLVLGGTVLFAIDDNKEPKYTKGDKINISVDTKMLSLSKNGETVVAALPENNTLVGKVSKHKIQVIVDGNKKNDIAYSLKTCDTDFECSAAIGQRLVSGGGQNVFSKELEFVFTPYQATISESGIPAKVEKTLDYGNEKFAECTVCYPAPVQPRAKKQQDAEVEAPQFIEKKVYIAVTDEVAASDVHIALNTEAIAIFETEHQIRLV